MLSLCSAALRSGSRCLKLAAIPRQTPKATMSVSLIRTLEDPFRMTFPLWPIASDRRSSQLALGACDVKETDKAVTFTIDAPGMTSDDVKVQLSEGILTISGEVSIIEEASSANAGIH